MVTPEVSEIYRLANKTDGDVAVNKGRFLLPRLAALPHPTPLSPINYYTGLSDKCSLFFRS